MYRMEPASLTKSSSLFCSTRLRPRWCPNLFTLLMPLRVSGGYEHASSSSNAGSSIDGTMSRLASIRADLLKKSFELGLPSISSSSVSICVAKCQPVVYSFSPGRTPRLTLLLYPSLVDSLIVSFCRNRVGLGAFLESSPLMILSCIN